MKRLFIFCSFLFIVSTTLAQPVCSKTKYYGNRNAKMEMRVIVESLSDDSLEELPTIDGTAQKVLKNPIVNSSDIEGLSIKDGDITIHFKPESWAKVRRNTLHNKGKKVAIIQNDKIVISAVLHGSLDRSAVIESLKKVDLKWFLKGFTPQQAPPHLDSDQAYIDFLLKWIQQNPDEISSIRSLAHLYMKDKESPQYRKALPLFEKLVKTEPDEGYYSMLLKCYVELKEYDKALRVANKWLSITPIEQRWSIYPAIGSIHAVIGNKEEAIKNYELSIELIKKADFTWLSGVDYGIFEKIAPKGLDKDELIQQIKTQIEQLKSQ